MLAGDARHCSTCSVPETVLLIGNRGWFHETVAIANPDDTGRTTRGF